MTRILRTVFVLAAGVVTVLGATLPAQANSEALIETGPCPSGTMGAYVEVNGVGAYACVSRVTVGPCPPGSNGVIVYVGSNAMNGCFVIHK